MLDVYEYAVAILRSHPRPRVRVTLTTGEVLTTPQSLMAACSPQKLTISTDGVSLRQFRWDQIVGFEKLPDPTVSH